MSQSQEKTLRRWARDLAHGVLFCVAVAFFIVGGVLTTPANLGLIGTGLAILAAIGIGRA